MAESDPVVNIPTTKVTISELIEPAKPKTTSKNEPLDNLIKEAIDRNKKLSNPPVVNEVKAIKVTESHNQKVLAILKNNGMDSQQAEHALKQLMEL